MPKAFPKECREDVIRVYRNSDASVAQVAKNFGISTIVPQALANHRGAELVAVDLDQVGQRVRCAA